MATWETIFDPTPGNTGQAIAARNPNLSPVLPAGVAGNIVGPSSGHSTILGGPMTNTHVITDSSCSTIIMGFRNTIQCFGTGPVPRFAGCYNTISNGCDNIVEARFGTIDNGADNAIFGINSGDRYNTINNGECSCIQDSIASIIGSGGLHCIVNGFTSNIHGGDHNCICWGGRGCGYQVFRSGILSGLFNRIESNCAGIVGGCCNHLLRGSDFGFIGTGNNNCINANSPNGFIGTGSNNVIDVNSPCSVIVGGQNNVHNASSFGFIGGGSNNNISNGTANVIGGGTQHRIDDTFSVIGGGISNIITPAPLPGCETGRNGILTGFNNQILGQSIFSSIESGGQNTICNGYTSMIGSGDFNIICNNENIVHRSFIGGGIGNHVCGDCSSIVGGQDNRISPDAAWNFIGGGQGNIANCCYSVIGSGLNNSIILTGAAPVGSSGILSGAANQIREHSVFSNIDSGINNTITCGYGVMIGSGDNNTVSPDPSSVNDFIANSFIGSGANNIVYADESSIVGGRDNFIHREPNSSIIGGGNSNHICDDTLFNCTTQCHVIGGGYRNHICFGHANVIVGGENNRMTFGSNLRYADHSFIGGGLDNQICSCCSVLGGGRQNCIVHTADGSVLGGGLENCVSGIGSALLGGSFNQVFAAHSAIAGGCINIDSGDNTNFIGSGCQNTIHPYVAKSVISGGGDNSIFNSSPNTSTTIYSVIGGGCKNNISSFTGVADTVSGGSNNVISANITNGNTIAGGSNNIIIGELNAVISGGFNNTVGCNNAIVVGGTINRSCNDYAAIVGGRTNLAEGIQSFIANGQDNNISNGSDNSFIGNGIDNRIINASAHSFIGAGVHNCISNMAAGAGNCPSTFSVIVGGCSNYIDTDTTTNSCFNNILGGEANLIAPQTCYATIAGGISNVNCGSGSFIGGGFSNTAANIGTFIGSGSCNQASGAGALVVGGGDPLFTFPVNNTSSGTNSFVGNGQYNTAAGAFSFIGNGGGVDATPTALGNEALANYSFVGNGVTNQVTSQSAFSFIGDGCQNKIGGSIAAALGAEYGFIGSGQNNCIDTGAAMSTATPFGVIGGGQNNTICAGATHSAIVGGQNNCVLHNWATVAGFGVQSQADCAFTTNCVIACNTPVFGAYAPGTLMYLPASTPPPPGACLVYIV